MSQHLIAKYSAHFLLRYLTSLLLLLLTGCGSSTNQVDSSYARSRGKSINGLSALQEILEARGHEVKAAWGVNDEVFYDAHVIIRLADRPGPPGAAEATWFDDWLQSDNTNLLIYAPRDADWLLNYWQNAVDNPDPSWDDRRKKAYEKNLSRARMRAGLKKAAAKNPANSNGWFKSTKIDTSKKVMPAFEWFGEWSAEGIVWPIDQAIEIPPAHALLKHREQTVIAEYGQRLYLASPGFFLNGGLIHPANRELTSKMIDWIEESHDGCQIVFVLGDDPLADPNEGNALWKFLTTWPSSALAGHLVLLGLLGCWSRALRQGPAREPRTEYWQQFSLHARAVGRLLEKSADLPAAATVIFQRYSKWRSAPALTLWEQFGNRGEDNNER
jgi:hypothetical protein